LNIIDLAIDIPSEEASVSYPECIRALLCINWNEPQAATYITQAALEQDLSTSWWMHTESAQVSTRSE